MNYTTEQTKPVIHLNGSGALELCEAYTAACEAVSEAFKVLCKCGPHGRDYPEGNFNQAFDEHHTRQIKLDEVRKELYALAEHCSKFVK